jgi:ATP-dependent Lon protease
MKRNQIENTMVTRSSKRLKKNNDNEFLDKCYMFDLSTDWKEEISEEEVNSLDKTQKTFMTREYKKVKDTLLERNVNIYDILSLKNLDKDEKTTLIEEYSFMRYMENSPFEFVLCRNKLNNKLKRIKNKKPNPRRERIEEIERNSSKEDEIEEKIFDIDLDDYHTNILYKKYKQLKKMSNLDSEYFKLKEFIDVITNFPFNKYSIISTVPHSSICNYLKYIKYQLDNELYGMKNVKEELLIMINHKLLHPEANNMILALNGPPGVGKTHIIQSLSKYLKLPYEHISMGGINDVSFLCGHSYTYEGSRPGKIVTSLTKMQSLNGILFFDEVDKIGTTKHGEEVTNKLIHMTDFTQNDKFCDKYMPEFCVDLSKMWFIFSCNDKELINPILKNRIRFIKVDGYSVKDKIEIVKKYLIPNNFKEYAINSDDYIFTDEIIEYIVKKTKEEQGVREIKRNIQQIFRKLELIKSIGGSENIEDAGKGSPDNMNISFNIKITENYTLTKKNIDTLLDSKHDETTNNPSLKMMYM